MHKIAVNTRKNNKEHWEALLQSKRQSGTWQVNKTRGGRGKSDWLAGQRYEQS